jgi:hypothetical protein
MGDGGGSGRRHYLSFVFLLVVTIIAGGSVHLVIAMAVTAESREQRKTKAQPPYVLVC